MTCDKRPGGANGRPVFLNIERDVMRTAALLILLSAASLIAVSEAATAAPANACKLCKEDYDACVKAHTKLACRTNMDICLNHCRPAPAPKSPARMKQQ